MKTRALLFVLAIVGFSGFTSCKNDTTTEATSSHLQEPIEESVSNKGQAYIDDESETPNAFRLALQSPDHTTLVAAIEAAGVQNSLVNVGPLTVFAPTNSAFDKVPKETLEELLKSENQKQLAYILKNHVAPSNYPIETLVKNVEKGRSLYMASGENVPVTIEDGDIFVGGTKIIATIKVSNGWVHVVEDVILPKNKITTKTDSCHIFPHNTILNL